MLSEVLGSRVTLGQLTLKKPQVSPVNRVAPQERGKEEPHVVGSRAALQLRHQLAGESRSFQQLTLSQHNRLQH